MKSILYILSFLLIFTNTSFSQVKSMSHRSKERKKVWRGWNKKRDAYNPYLKKKNKNKPSVQMAKGEKKEIRRQRRAYRKQTKMAKKNKK